MAMLAEAVLMAGTDTTRNQLACSIALFADHPDQWALLAEQPELATRAVEESMRFLGAVRGTMRFASEDIVYRDVLFPQGTIVSTSLAGANRDPEVWQDPNDFDITTERTTAQMTHWPGPNSTKPSRCGPGACRASSAVARWSGSRPPSGSGDRPRCRSASRPRR
jgi:cytochrome P450